MTSLILFFGILVYITYIKATNVRDILKPSIIFSLIILITYFITSLRLSLLQNSYPVWFTLLIVGLLLVFYMGEQSSILFAIKKNYSDNNYSVLTMRVLTFFVWLIIMLSFIQMVRILGAPPAISKGERADYFVSGWGSIVITQSSFWALLLFDRFNKNANRWLFWIYCSSIIIVAFLLSNKFQIIYMIVLYLIAYNSYKKRIKVKTIALAGVIGIIVFPVLFELVYKEMYGISLEMLFISYKMKIPRVLAFLTQPYLYVAFNFDNLYHFIISETSFLYGLKSFGSILELLGLQGLYPSETVSNLTEWQKLLRVKSMTTGTLFQDFAQDGGIIGMVVLTYLIGFWSGLTHRLFKVSKSFASFFLYSATTSAIFMSFFSNVFTSKVTIVNIFAAIIFSGVLKNSSYL